jgi:hypothetical protein
MSSEPKIRWRRRLYSIDCNFIMRFRILEKWIRLCFYSNTSANYSYIQSKCPARLGDLKWFAIRNLLFRISDFEE